MNRKIMGKNDICIKNYEILKLKDCILQLNTGLNPRQNFSLGNGRIKYITAKNLNKSGTIDFSTCDFIDENAKKIINKRSDIKIGDILFSSRAPIGHCHLIKEEPNYYDIGESIFSIRVNPKIILPEYLCIYFTSSYFIKLASKNTTGSVIKEIRIADLMNMDIIVPEEKLQRKIAKTIDIINNKIENNNQINNNLEELMKTIYQRWFIEFEFPNEEGKPYKSFGGKLIYNENLKREIPEGWGVENIVKNQLTSIVENGVDYFESKQYLATGDVEENEILSSSMIEYETRESRANMQPIINSVWFAKMKNSIKHLCFGEYSIEMINNYILSTGFCGLKCAEHSFEYINEFINSEYFEKHKDVLAHGATQEAVNNEDLKNIKILIPNDCILREFHNISKDIYEQIYNNKLEKQKLIKTREFLLPLLMNGQINVEDIEI